MVAAEKAGAGLLTPVDKEEDFFEKLCSTGIKGEGLKPLQARSGPLNESRTLLTGYVLSCTADW